MKTENEMWKELKTWLWTQEALSPYDQERTLLRSIYKKNGRNGDSKWNPKFANANILEQLILD